MYALFKAMDSVLPRWYVLSSKSGIKALEDQFNALSAARVEQGREPVEYFLPTCVVQSSYCGKPVVKRKKLISNYVFVKDTIKNILDMKQQVSSLWILPHPDNTPDVKRYMTISDHDMEVFKAVAHAYANELPCYPIDAIDLEDGDRVQIIGGPFDGLTGRLRCSQGRNGGKVLMSVGDLFLISTPDISPQYIRILEFGKGNRHPYRQFEAHLARAVQALRHLRGLDGTQELTTGDIAAMTIFTGRFEQLQAATVNIASQHATLMLMSYTVLQDKAKTTAWRQRCDRLLPVIKSDTQRAWQLAFMFASTGDPELRSQAQALTSTWTITPSDRKRTLIASALSSFSMIS